MLRSAQKYCCCLHCIMYYSVLLAICFYHFVLTFLGPHFRLLQTVPVWFFSRIFEFLESTCSLHSLCTSKGKVLEGGQKVVGKNIKDAEDCHHHKRHRFLLSIKEMVRNSAPPLELSVSPCTLFSLFKGCSLLNLQRIASYRESTTILCTRY